MTSRTVTEANPNCAATFASLRLFGDDLIPEEISRMLRLEPTESVAKGTRTLGSAGRARTAPTGRWILATHSHIQSPELEDHLNWLLARLEDSQMIPADIPGITRADICCYWASATGQGGPEFTPEVLGRLAKCHLGLSLDLYFDPT